MLSTKTSDERKVDTINDDWTKTEFAPFTARNSERLRRRVLINDERARQKELMNQYWIRLKNAVYNSWTWRHPKISILRVFGVTLLYFIGKVWIIWQRGVLAGLDARWERERQEDIRLRQERLARRPVPERRPKNRQNKRRRP
ncbi:hypothetical protein OS493_029381 [Desmophyllum pertusum]|uniref:Uncharacterized protein n=1 Tax=Desmophyllum pertusum TaxID=174260 RepID=A0A9W9YWN6_9CNID|nr:hypothetical protein OS493_029381 [Desmophyllum pertusum]